MTNGVQIRLRQEFERKKPMKEAFRNGMTVGVHIQRRQEFEGKGPMKGGLEI